MNRLANGLFAVGALVLALVLVLVLRGRDGSDPASDDAAGPGASALASASASATPTSPVETASAVPTPTDPVVPPTAAPTDPGPVVPTCLDLGPASHLVVMSFNIHGGTGQGGYNLAGVAAEIRASDADVVLLQEVDRGRARSRFEDQPAELGQELGMQSVFGANVVRGTQEYGTAILSKYPIVGSSNAKLPNFPGLEQRGLLRATIQLLDQKVDIYNTHLQHTSGTVRTVQMQAIKGIVGPVARPKIVGGDFNAVPGQDPLRVASEFLTDPWPQVGDGSGFTQPAKRPLRRIDFLLYGGGLVPTDGQVLPTVVSDHRAVRVGFDVVRKLSCG